MIWNLDPIAFSIFGIAVRWYGLAYLLGGVLGFFIGYPIQSTLLKNPMTKNQWSDLVASTLLAGIVGGRVGEFLFYQTPTLLTDPTQVLALWQGGMSIHGGILGSCLYLWWYTHRHHISFLRLADSLVIPLFVSLGFGRIANYINGELAGQPTGTDWGVIFPHIDSVLRHPSQLYESAHSFIGAALLLLLIRPSRQHKGILSIGFLVLYAVGRFFIEFYKTGVLYAGLTTGQWLCIVMLIIAAGIYTRHFVMKQ